MPIVRMPAHRAGAGTRLADVAAQQQQRHQALDRRHAASVLGEPHAPAGDGGIAVEIDRRSLFDLRARQARFAFDVVPCRRAHLVGERVVAERVGIDEGMVDRAVRRERVARGIGVFDHHFRDAQHHRQIAADPRLEVVRGDRGRAAAEHLGRRLRVGEAFQAALSQRVEHDDAAAALRGATQFAEHARMVGARVLAEHEDRFGALEVVQRHRALAAADLLGHRHAGWLVAHVRTVGQVVGAVGAHEQLVEEGGLVRGAAGGVEDRLVRRRQGLQCRCDLREGRVPADRHVAVAVGLVGHGLGQPTLGFQVLVVLLRQPRHRVRGEEVAVHAP
jgi:hypothetical protein